MNHDKNYAAYTHSHASLLNKYTKVNSLLLYVLNCLQMTNNAVNRKNVAISPLSLSQHFTQKAVCSVL